VADATFDRPDPISSYRLYEMGLDPAGSISSRLVRCWRALFSSPTDGVTAAAAKEHRDSVLRRLAHEPLSLRPRRCRSPPGATGARGADTCGAKTPAGPPRRGRSCLAVACGGRWRPWSAPHGGPRRRGHRRLLAHRQHRSPRRGPPSPHRRPAPLRQRPRGRVDEHAWRHTRRGEKYVTAIIDLTAVRAGTGPGAEHAERPSCGAR
jgi:hypothetical protein